MKIRVLTGRMGSRAVLGTVLTAAIYLPAALAQDGTPQSVAPSTQLEEVLVTAERGSSNASLSTMHRENEGVFA
jgi:hypothetical protein